MLNHEEKIELAKKKKKILLRAVFIIIGVFLIIGIVLLIFSAVWHRVAQGNISDAHANPMQRRFIHPDPNWYRNIFEEASYMELDRSIKFNDSGAITEMREDNLERYPMAAQFMYNVVHLIKNGEYEAYNDIFADEYWDNLRRTGRDAYGEMFPMQALYNIEIRIIDSAPESADVVLSHMIYRNDGMFRPDLSYNDGDMSPVIYSLIIDRDGEIRVLRKSPYAFLASGELN